MASFVISFRSPLSSRPEAAEEVEWQRWFGELGSTVTDFGQRVGRVRALGSGERRGDALAGYVVIDADDLDKAVEIAQGCPGLRHGRGVEVGEAVES